MPKKSDTVRVKGVHIKLDRETHAHFKARLVHIDLTMQEAFEEFARLVAAGSLSANRMLDGLIRRQIKQELSTIGMKPVKRKHKRLGELDADKLYDLINEDADNLS